MDTLQLVTWNVNGLRAILSKNFYPFIHVYKPDILCLQETKVYSTVCPKIEGFKYVYFNHSEEKKGYSGTAILSQIEPLQVRCMDLDSQHPEGRIIIAEFATFYLINTYVPNAQGDLRRLPYRVQVWDTAMRALLVSLEKNKPILWCGDLNVAHCPIDLANPDANHFSAGFTDEERQSFSAHLATGFTDVFRFFHPQQPEQYSWWSYRTRARERNIGWRIDYFISSPKLLPHITACNILSQVFGSDHAPVQLFLDKACFSL